MTVARFDEVTVARHGRTIVDRATFEVQPGTVHALLGHNGAGKTTLLRALCGMVPLAGGRIVADRTPAVLFAHTRLPGDLAVADLLEHRSRQCGRTRLEAADIAARTGVARFAEVRAARLSTGMAQRAGLALALLAGSDLLVLDEPTTGLDPQGVTSLLDLIRSLRDEGRTVMICSHDLSRLELVCDDITCLRGGRVTATGSIAALSDGLPASGQLLRTSDDGRAARLLVADGVAARRTPRGVRVPAGTDLSRAIATIGPVHEVTAEAGLFDRVYDRYAGAPEAERSRRPTRRRSERRRAAALRDVRS